MTTGKLESVVVVVTALEGKGVAGYCNVTSYFSTDGKLLAVRDPRDDAKLEAYPALVEASGHYKDMLAQQNAAIEALDKRMALGLKKLHYAIQYGRDRAKLMKLVEELRALIPKS